jgi:hypothetical protein
MGHPCAKIVHTMAMGSQATAKGGISANRQSMEETIWFALDKGQVIKMVRNQSYDTAGGATAAPDGGAGGGKNGGTGNSGGSLGKGGGAPRRPAGGNNAGR